MQNKVVCIQEKSEAVVHASGRDKLKLFVWKAPIYCMKMLLFLVHWGNTTWIRNTMRITCVCVHTLTYVARLCIIYYYFVNYQAARLTLVAYTSFSEMYLLTLILIFLWKSLWTKQVDLVLHKLEMKRIISSVNFKLSFMMTFALILSVALLTTLLYTVVRFVLAHLPQEINNGSVLLAFAVAVLDPLLRVYSVLSLISLSHFTSSIFASVVTQIQMMKLSLIQSISNDEIYQDESVFCNFTETWRKLTEEVKQIQTLFSFVFGMYLFILLNSFVCNIYLQTILSHCNVDISLYHFALFVNAHCFMVFTLSAALAHSEVRTVSHSSFSVSSL